MEEHNNNNIDDMSVCASGKQWTPNANEAMRRERQKTSNNLQWAFDRCELNMFRTHTHMLSPIIIIIIRRAYAQRHTD